MQRRQGHVACRVLLQFDETAGGHQMFVGFPGSLPRHAHDGPCLVGFPSKRLWEKGIGFTFEKLFKRFFQGKASLQDCYLSSWTLDRSCLIP